MYVCMYVPIITFHDKKWKVAWFGIYIIHVYNSTAYEHNTEQSSTHRGVSNDWSLE